MENTQIALVPGTRAHFDAWLETQTDAVKEGALKGYVRYTLAPLSAMQMASITVSLALAVKYYQSIGEDSIPIHEITTVLEKLVENPA